MTSNDAYGYSKRFLTGFEWFRPLKTDFFVQKWPIFGHPETARVEKTTESGAKIQFLKGSKEKKISKFFSKFFRFGHVLGHWEAFKDTPY